MLVGAGRQHIARRGDDLQRPQIVHGQPVLAHEPAEPSAQGETCHAGHGYRAARAGQALELGLAVVVTPRGPALGPCPARPWVDVHGAHGGQVDHEAAVADRVAGDVVAATPDGDLQSTLAAKAHRGLHVGGAEAAGDDGRASIDQAVLDAPGEVVSGIAGRQRIARQLLAERVHGLVFNGHGHSPVSHGPFSHTRGTAATPDTRPYLSTWGAPGASQTPRRSGRPAQPGRPWQTEYSQRSR